MASRNSAKYLSMRAERERPYILRRLKPDKSSLLVERRLLAAQGAERFHLGLVRQVGNNGTTRCRTLWSDSSESSFSRSAFSGAGTSTRQRSGTRSSTSHS